MRPYATDVLSVFSEDRWLTLFHPVIVPRVLRGGTASVPVFFSWRHRGRPHPVFSGARMIVPSKSLNLRNRLLSIPFHKCGDVFRVFEIPVHGWGAGCVGVGHRVCTARARELAAAKEKAGRLRDTGPADAISSHIPIQLRYYSFDFTISAFLVISSILPGTGSHADMVSPSPCHLGTM
jgi:hypothetical protein